MTADISNNSDTNILVVYHSQTGNTRKMAEAVAKGAGSVKNVRVVLKKAADATLEDLEKCYELGRLIAAGCEMKIF